MRYGLMTAAAALVLAACGNEGERAEDVLAVAAPQGEELIIEAAERSTVIRAAGTAEPVQQATLSTKLMGSVTVVHVQVGDTVRAGQPLLRIDARDLTARSAQLEAALLEAQAVHAEAELQAGRVRALFADEAAPRAQLDAAETGLARARAGVDAVRASALELAAAREYSVIRAPFNGVIASRLVDPGSFAAPGAPLVVVHDNTSLRITATAAPDAIRGTRRGQQVSAEVEGQRVMATIEGIVPAAGGSLYLVNAVVTDPDGVLLPRGAAVRELPQSVRGTIVVPQAALVRQGELTGVRLKRGDDVLLRWIRTGPQLADSVEVVSGLRQGDVVIVPAGR
jgi:RND family efflux transporter MFP subunit